MAEAVAPEPAAPATPEPATPAAPAWTDGMDADTLGLIETKGYKSASELGKAYVHASSMLGTPANQLVKIPSDPDNTEQMGNFHRQLGRPDTPEGYDLPKVEVPQGQENVLEPAFRKAAHDAGVSQKHAHALYQWYVGHAAGVQTQNQASRDQQSQLADIELKQEWGAEYDANMAHAKRFASVFGLAEDWLSQVEDAAGTKGLYKGAAKIGRAIAEHKFADTDDPEAGDQPFGLTPNAARTQISQLLSNAEFLEPYQSRTHPGHQVAVEKMQGLQKLAAAGK